MLIVWHPTAWADYLYWQQNDKKMLFRINDLIKDTMRHPFDGIGKPEPLRGNLKGQWSRRITQEHRLTYLVKTDQGDQTLVILQCRFHY